MLVVRSRKLATIRKHRVDKKVNKTKNSIARSIPIYVFVKYMESISKSKEMSMIDREHE